MRKILEKLEVLKKVFGYDIDLLSGSGTDVSGNYGSGIAAYFPDD